MPLVNRAPIDPVTGKLMVTTATPTPAWPSIGGMTYHPTTGELAVIDAVPAANDPWNGGIRFTHLGAMYVTTTLPTPLFYVGGIVVSADGRVFFSSSPPLYAVGGWPIAGDGGIAGSGLAPTASFFAPLMTTLVPTTAGNPTFTFARAALAYAMDFEGILRQSIANEARFQGARRVRNCVSTTSEDFSNAAAWQRDATVTVTAGQVDPLGGTTAYKVTSTTASAGIYNTTLSGLGLVTFSVWMRGEVGGEVIIFGFTGNVTLTTSWQRVSVTEVINDGFMRMRPVAANKTFYVWHAQSERVEGQSNQAPSEYVSVGVLAAPYHGNWIDGVKYFATRNGNSVAANVVTEATGTAIPLATTLGYIAENAATNILPRSQEFNTGWTPENVAIAADQIAAPDGTLTADKFTDNAVNGLHRIYGGIAVANATVYTYSVYAKAGTLTWMQLFVDIPQLFANFNLVTGVTGNKSGGVTSTITALPGGWYRCSMTFTTSLTNGNAQIFSSLTDVAAIFPAYIGTGQTMYLWGAQVEQASDPSSYIPTTTAAVTRASDYLNYQMLSNVDGALGSSYAESYLPAAFVGSQQVAIICDFVTFYPNYYEASKALNIFSGVSAATANARVVGAVNRGASGWGGSTASVCLNGGAVGTGGFNTKTNSGLFNPGGTAIYSLRGCLRNVNIYATRLTDAQLIALTTIPIPDPIFFAPLTSSLIPTTAGNPTPTFNRANLAYVSGVAPTGNAADGELLILCAANEARFAGARRVSQGVWSETYADGSPIPAAKLLGYVAENLATNLCTQSQAIDDSSATGWVKNDATVVNDATVAAPDGTLTADRFTDNATNSFHRAFSAVITQTVGLVYTNSVYAKAGTLPWLQLLVDGSGRWANFNLATGAVGFTSAGVTTSVQTLPNGWYRFAITYTALATVTSLQLIGINANINALNPPYIGTGQTMFLWGAQLEQRNFATSYIPTVGVAVSRVGDVLQYPNVGNIVDTVGSGYFEATPFGDGSATSPTRVFIGANGINRLLYYTDSGTRMYDGITNPLIQANLSSGTVLFKAAFKWSGLLAGYFRAGVQLTNSPTAWDGSWDMTDLAIGLANNNPPNCMISAIRNVKIWNTALIDEQLKALTT